MAYNNFYLPVQQQNYFPQPPPPPTYNPYGDAQQQQIQFYNATSGSSGINSYNRGTYPPVNDNSYTFGRAGSELQNRLNQNVQGEPILVRPIPQYPYQYQYPSTSTGNNNAYAPENVTYGPQPRPSTSGVRMYPTIGNNAGWPPAPAQTQTQRVPVSDSSRDEEFSDKLISYARFNRNTNLMKEILSDTVLPDVSQVVTHKRLDALTEHVRLLQENYEKVNKEVQEVEKKCSERKRKFEESTDKFYAAYEPMCRPALGRKTYLEMFHKYYNYWKLEAERQQWEQTLAWAHQTAAASVSVQPNHHQSAGLAEILGLGANNVDAGAETSSTPTHEFC